MFVGMLNLAAAGSILLLISLLRAGFEVNLKEQIRSLVLLSIPTIVPLLVLFACWGTMLKLFSMKMPPYNFGNVGMYIEEEYSQW